MKTFTMQISIGDLLSFLLILSPIHDFLYYYALLVNLLLTNTKIRSIHITDLYLREGGWR
jgi:hypothetical protein